MLKHNQKGIAHILVILILLLGIVGGVYLIKHPQIFKPKAFENGEVNFMDNGKRNYPNNTTDNIFVYLEVKPPSWEAQTGNLPFNLIKTVQAAEEQNSNTNNPNNGDIDPDSYQYTTGFRVSLEESKLNPESDCVITGDPETNCQEITLNKPTETTYLSWVLPKKGGNYTMHTKFFSNKGNSKDVSSNITFNDSGDIGAEVPAILVGGQALATTLVDVLKKVPGTAAFNAAAVFITRVQSAGEQIITLSQAQQLGFGFNFQPNEDSTVDFDYDQEQLSKLDISLEFFPDLDPLTGEPRLQVNPKAALSDQEDVLQGSLDIVAGEIGGRVIGNLVGRGAAKIAQTQTFKIVKSKVKIDLASFKTTIKQKVVNRFIFKKQTVVTEQEVRDELIAQGYPYEEVDQATKEVNQRLASVAQDRIGQITKDLNRVKTENQSVIDQLKDDPELVRALQIEGLYHTESLINSRLESILEKYNLSEIETVRERLRQEILDGLATGRRVETYTIRHNELVPFADIVQDVHPSSSIQTQVKDALLLERNSEGVLQGNLSDEEITEMVQRAQDVATHVTLPKSGQVQDIADIIGSINQNLLDTTTSIGRDQRRLINILFAADAFNGSYYSKLINQFLTNGGKAEDLPAIFGSLLAENKSRYSAYHEFWDGVIKTYNEEYAPAVYKAGFSRKVALVDPEDIVWTDHNECYLPGACINMTPLGDPNNKYFSLWVDMEDGPLVRANVVENGTVSSLDKNIAMHSICHEACHEDVTNMLGIRNVSPNDRVVGSILEELTERNTVLAEREVIKLKPEIFSPQAYPYKFYEVPIIIGDSILDNLGLKESEIRSFALNQDAVGYIKFLDQKLNVLSQQEYKNFIEGLYNNGIIGPSQKDLLLRKRANSVLDINLMSWSWAGINPWKESISLFGKSIEDIRGLNSSEGFNLPAEALESRDKYSEYIENQIKDQAFKDDHYLPNDYYSETYAGQQALNFQRPF